MAALVPAIHVLCAVIKKDVDARDNKPGRDDMGPLRGEFTVFLSHPD
jgi:hypothetical protein